MAAKRYEGKLIHQFTTLTATRITKHNEHVLEHKSSTEKTKKYDERHYFGLLMPFSTQLFLFFNNF